MGPTEWVPFVLRLGSKLRRRKWRCKTRNNGRWQTARHDGLHVLDVDRRRRALLLPPELRPRWQVGLWFPAQ